VRWFVTLIAGLLPVVMPLPGGGSGKVEERPLAPKAFRSTVSFVEPDGASDPSATDGAKLFPRFLKRKALLNSPPSVSAAALGPSTDAHEILLTFDDGPDLATTPLVLQELDRRGLKGVFFVNGRSLMGDKPADRARRHLLRKLATHGHLVGNHSMTHQELCADQGTIPHEIDDNAEMIAAITGVYPMLFRSPYGGTCPALEKALAERGLTNVGWNVDPQEWRGVNANDTVPAVTEQLIQLKGRGIILLHDTHASTARALPSILDWIEEHNRVIAAGGDKLIKGKNKRVSLPYRIMDYTALLPEHRLPESSLYSLLSFTFLGTAPP
jgi:peptidoglycan-N-acetylglucosamine deacetylase